MHKRQEIQLHLLCRLVVHGNSLCHEGPVRQDPARTHLARQLTAAPRTLENLRHAAIPKCIFRILDASEVIIKPMHSTVRCTARQVLSGECTQPRTLSSGSKTEGSKTTRETVQHDESVDVFWSSQIAAVSAELIAHTSCKRERIWIERASSV